MNQFEKYRLSVYEKLFSAPALCAAGVLIMPSFLFNPNTMARTFQFLFFWFLVWLSGKKTKLFLTIIVIVCITAFNLIIPYGRILFLIGPFKITEGALVSGIHRAITVEGLIMLSKLTISKDLRLPGYFGETLSRSLRIFYRITTIKIRIRPRNFLSDLDAVMLELSDEAEFDIVDMPRMQFKGYVILSAVILSSWSLWLWGIIS
jgi:heptaprenyl diphosphate synthase